MANNVLPEKFNNRWHYPRLVLVAAQMFADLQNGRQNQGTGTRVVKGSNQLGQDFVLANLWRNLIQFFCQTGEKSEIIN